MVRDRYPYMTWCAPIFTYYNTDVLGRITIQWVADRLGEKTLKKTSARDDNHLDLDSLKQFL